MKAVGYIRVSTDEQVQEGVSLDNQRKRIEAFCVAKDWEMVDVYEDAGKSGKDLKRAGIQQLISDAKAGKFGIVVIYKLDRLTRSVKDLGYLIELFDKHEIAFSSVSDNFDTTTANGRLVLNILGSVAQWERDIIAERTKEALAHKRELGQKTGGDVPFGYDVAEDGTLVENPKEQKVAHHVRQLRDEGMSYNAIAKALNSKGYTTKRGCSWTHKQVKRVLAA